MDITGSESQGWMRNDDMDSQREAPSSRYSEGNDFTINGSQGVIEDIWTDGEHTGPDGTTWQVTAPGPVYIVRTDDGRVAATASNLSDRGDDQTSG